MTQPLIFEPLFMERVWGGRRLEQLYAKRLPPVVPIGESWEIVDRADAQSVVHSGPRKGQTLHELWETQRVQIFGDLPETPRFPLLIKILDAREKLSVQVHPPPDIAKEIGGEPKTEFWYIADAVPGAALYVGLTSDSSRAQFGEAIKRGRVEAELHRLEVRTGDSMFLPSGRVHAIGAGNVIFEIQQNSDTTFRVFDWNRLENGQPRKLHVEESLLCIDFEDKEPKSNSPRLGTLVEHEFFHVEKWNVHSPRSAELDGRFAIICCLSGLANCGGVEIVPGGFCLVPASLGEVELQSLKSGTEVLRITIPR